MDIKKRISGLIHLIGAVLAIPGTVLLLVFNGNSAWKIVSFAIYGTTLFILFLASTLYHWLPKKAGGKNQIFRKFDHLAIYFMIAGTYTPFCLVSLHNTSLGWTIFGITWGLTIITVTLQSIYINLPRWLTTSFYIIMGWLIIITVKPLSLKMPLNGIILIFAGGIIYTIGGIIYTIKKPNLFKSFNYHALWHTLVLIAASLHYLVMLNYVF